MTDDQRRDPLAPAAAEGGLPSMSTDNTPEGRLDAEGVAAGPIVGVREGMKVLDANGDDVGSVRRVRMGDPEAVTDRGQVMEGADTWWDDIANALFGPDADLPESTRHEYERVGFIQIDARGIFNADYLASALQIAGVSSDEVRLNVDRDALVRL
jgi:hypothetical protein